MARPTKKSSTKKTKRNVPSGTAYIQSTFNNTIVTIADTKGDVISWASAGSSGFKGAKKRYSLCGSNCGRLGSTASCRSGNASVRSNGEWSRSRKRNCHPRLTGSWLRNHFDSGCYADPPQWLPPPKTPASIGLLNSCLELNLELKFN